MSTSCLSVLVFLFLLQYALATINLIQTSPSEICPGQNVVFRCEINAASSLVWEVPPFPIVPFTGAPQINQAVDRGKFTFVLLNVTDGGSTFISRATLENATVNDNETLITCSSGTDISEKRVYIADEPQLTTDDETVNLEYNNREVNITWNIPVPRRCIVQYEINIISSTTSGCSFNFITANTFYIPPFIEGCESANYFDSFIVSLDEAGRRGPKVQIYLGEPDSVTSSSIVYDYECTSDGEGVLISLNWTPVLPGNSSLAIIGYSVKLNISNTTENVTDTEAEFIFSSDISGECIIGSVSTSNGFRDGPFIPATPTCLPSTICPTISPSATPTPTQPSSSSGLSKTESIIIGIVISFTGLVMIAIGVLLIVGGYCWCKNQEKA